jgi:hypothetical protein
LEPVLYPTQIDNLEVADNPVVTSNTSRHELCAPSIHIGCPRIPSTHTVADTGATSALVMANTPMKNVQIAPNPLNINFLDGKMIHSTHISDVKIPGLPHVLEGHIVPALNGASLIGIRILCKVGCRVVFMDTACYVKYNGKNILWGTIDPSTNLWLLPPTPNAITGKVKRSCRPPKEMMRQAPLPPNSSRKPALLWPAPHSPQSLSRRLQQWPWQCVTPKYLLY